LTLALAAAGQAIAGSASVTGHGYFVAGDAHQLGFELRIEAMDVDTVLVTRPAQVMIYADGQAVTSPNVRCEARREEGTLALSGTIALTDEETLDDLFAVDVRGNDGGERRQIWEWHRLHLGTLTWAIMPQLGFGYYEADMGPELASSGLFAAIEVGLGYLSDHSEYRVRWSGQSSLGGTNRFNLTESPFFRYEHLPWGHRDGRPSLLAGVGRVNLTQKRGPRRFDETEWGAEVGLVWRGAFERLTARWISTHGGIAVGEAYFGLLRAGEARIGTRYAVYRQDQAWTARVQFVMEFTGVGDGDTDTLMRIDDRPWWRKALAYGSVVPVLPILLVMSWLD
jgi:hypothetical protein